MTESVAIVESITQRGPQIFAVAGLLLMLLGGYMAGADSMTCARHGERVDCNWRVTRALGFATVEQQEMVDVISLEVRRSTSDRGDASSSDSSNPQTTTNDTLYVTTRQGRKVRTLGGEACGRAADQVGELLRGRAAAPVAIVDSTWTVAGAAFGIGLVLSAFGAVAAVLHE
jgi:hypothetical protein